MPEGEGQVAEATATDTESSGDEEATESKDANSDAIGRLTERLDKFIDTVNPPEGDEANTGLYDQVADDLYGDYYDDDDEDLDEGGEEDDSERSPEDEAREIVQQFVDQKVQERLDPVLAQQREQQRIADIQSLEQSYPELGKKEHAAPLLAKAQEIAQAIGVPELAYEAPFLETVYLRAKGEGVAAKEREAAAKNGSETALETAGGTGNRGGEGDVDLADEIVKARKGGSSRSFLIGS